MRSIREVQRCLLPALLRTVLPKVSPQRTGTHQSGTSECTRGALIEAFTAPLIQPSKLAAPAL
jgi:hypothetical protein